MPQSGDGIIYAIDINRQDADVVGPVVTFVARLPHWVVMTPEIETELRAYVQSMDNALRHITGSEKSDANRRAFSEAAGRKHP